MSTAEDIGTKKAIVKAFQPRAHSVEQSHSLSTSGQFDGGLDSSTRQAVRSLEKTSEVLSRRVAAIEAHGVQQDAGDRDLREQIERLSSDNLQLRRELEAAHKQLEQDSIAIDRERGRGLDLQEQLRYLTAQLNLWHTEQLTPVQASYWALAGWVYIPLLYVVRGVWVLLWPVVHTFQRMTLFGYTPEDGDRLGRPPQSGTGQLSTGNDHRRRGGDAKNGTGSLSGSGSRATKHVAAHEPGALLAMLQDGKLLGADKLSAAAARRRAETSQQRQQTPSATPMRRGNSGATPTAAGPPARAST